MFNKSRFYFEIFVIIEAQIFLSESIFLEKLERKEMSC